MFKILMVSAGAIHTYQIIALRAGRMPGDLKIFVGMQRHSPSSKSNYLVLLTGNPAVPNMVPAVDSNVSGIQIRCISNTVFDKLASTLRQMSINTAFSDGFDTRVHTIGLTKKVEFAAH